MTTPDRLLARIDGARRAVTSLNGQVPLLVAATRSLRMALERGGTVYTCGNGGSAAEALHMAEELIGRYRGDRGPLRAVCLNADPTAMTCIANDFGYEAVFARQCEALVGEGDVLVVLTTSGKSANVVRALEAARAKGATTIGLLGGDGGACRALCDHAIVVDAEDSAHVQEAHLVIVHLFCEALER